MKKMILSLAVMAVFLAFPLTAHAAEMLEKDYIKAEIWEEIWLGKNDDGTEFPESSYKHHLLEKWVDENYDDDNYDWTAIGELKYLYKNYYKNLTENWDSMTTTASGLSKPKTIFTVFGSSIISGICLTKMAVSLIFS